MTPAERAEIERAAPSSVTLSWLPHDDPRFVRLVAGPCPLYDAAKRTCTVYAVRPMNCRRFGCMRMDYSKPYDQGPQTRQDKRQLIVMQRHAQRWGRSHGWEG
jgi:Fe-S-cluster containining protein